jgi:hypothetical protein
VLILAYYNRITFLFTDDDARANALLGSPNGLGAAYLLAQHKAQLGVQSISGVILWTSTSVDLYDDDVVYEYSEFFPNLCFVVQPISDLGLA